MWANTRIQNTIEPEPKCNFGTCKSEISNTHAYHWQNVVYWDHSHKSSSNLVDADIWLQKYIGSRSRSVQQSSWSLDWHLCAIILAAPLWWNICELDTALKCKLSWQRDCTLWSPELTPSYTHIDCWHQRCTHIGRSNVCIFCSPQDRRNAWIDEKQWWTDEQHLCRPPHAS